MDERRTSWATPRENAGSVGCMAQTGRELEGGRRVVTGRAVAHHGGRQGRARAALAERAGARLADAPRAQQPEAGVGRMGSPGHAATGLAAGSWDAYAAGRAAQGPAPPGAWAPGLAAQAAPWPPAAALGPAPRQHLDIATPPGFGLSLSPI